MRQKIPCFWVAIYEIRLLTDTKMAKEVLLPKKFTVDLNSLLYLPSQVHWTNAVGFGDIRFPHGKCQVEDFIVETQ